MQAQPLSRSNQSSASLSPFSEPRSRRRTRGLPLVEVSLVITVMLGLISVLLIGFKAYKEGADRATCIQNIGTVQKAMRSYSNLNGNFPGDAIGDFQSEIIGPNKFLNALAPCPGGGTYTFSGDTIVEVGDLYINCSIGDHEPTIVHGW
jgi:hypothetical protein